MPHGYNPFIRRGAEQWTCRVCGFWNDDDWPRCDDCGCDEDGNPPADETMDEAA